ncbi:MAG: rhodanese-like domain-containing protein [Candidatus Gracilibacteria bacterium]|jgi:rhodanese-related sulfurtransferase
MKVFKFTVVFALAVLVLVACVSSSDVKVDVLSVGNSLKSPSEVNRILGADGLRIIDVRTLAEFTSGCISGAKNIDFKSSDFLNKISLLDKSGLYLVYCRSGGRSAQAVAQMRGAGFNNIVELKGGISGWEAEGYDLSENCK